jgi:hypothetical protein
MFFTPIRVRAYQLIAMLMLTQQYATQVLAGFVKKVKKF